MKKNCDIRIGAHPWGQPKADLADGLFNSYDMDYEEIISRLQRMIAEILGERDRESLDINESLTELGFDDGAVYGLVSPVNEEFNTDFELDDFDEFETIVDIADAVNEKLNP